MVLLKSMAPLKGISGVPQSTTVSSIKEKIMLKSLTNTSQHREGIYRSKIDLNINKAIYILYWANSHMCTVHAHSHVQLGSSVHRPLA